MPALLKPASLKIVFIGCGNMGGAMLRGFLAQNAGYAYTIIKPTPHNFENVAYFPTHQAGKNALKKADIIFLAVKPQIMRDVIKDLLKLVNSNTILISIAAGIKLATYEETFPQNPIIRTLPNTPSAIAKGMNILIANSETNKMQIKTTNTLFESLGQTLWIKDENDMDAASAISASGPAYIFYIIEAIAKAGENMGLTADTAMALARQTVIGAAALAQNAADTPACVLRENVTSKGGMTKAALDILMNGELQKILNDALNAAKTRSQELSA